MNAMTQALKEANVRVPTQSERIWGLVRERTKEGLGTTSREAHKLLRESIAYANVSSLMSQMEARDLLYSKERPYPTGGRRARAYYCDSDEFKMSPLLPRGTVRKEPEPASLDTSALPVMVHDAGHDWDKFIDNLSIAQARVLHRKLSQLFA